MKKGSKRHGYQLKNKYKKSLRNNLLKEILLLSKDNVESLSYTLPVLKCEDVLIQDSNNYCDANINNTYSNNKLYSTFFRKLEPFLLHDTIIVCPVGVLEAVNFDAIYHDGKRLMDKSH